MIRSRKRQAGIKLIELLLVMVIGASIVYFSFLQYQSYRRDADVVQLRYNVDLIFQAMANYFRANCNSSPLNTDYTDVSYPITLDQLKKGGFFTATLAMNPIVSQTTAEEGYVMQFNQVQPLPPRMMSFTLDPKSPPVQAELGRILIWQVQVSVALKNTDTAQSYLALLQANCLSNPGSAGAITPCPRGTTTSSSGSYAVWSQLPSFASSQGNSNYWTSMPILRQFTQRYTMYPIIIIDNKAVYADQQFFICGV